MSNWNDSKVRPCRTVRCTDAGQHQNRNGHYATNRKVAGSVQDEVSNWPNPFSHTMALGSTQFLTEMNTKNLLGGKGRPTRKADNFTAVFEPIVWKMWGPRRLTTLRASAACYRDTFTWMSTVNTKPQVHEHGFGLAIRFITASGQQYTTLLRRS
jgi:hypothetical protein